MSAPARSSDDPTPNTPAPAASTCDNCAAPLSGPYCADCGQRAAGRVVPLRQVIKEFLETLFELDLRILHTLPTFFLRPGRLTTEYVQGRRRRYIRPLRLYLFSSFLLFTVLALTNRGTPSVVLSPSPEEGQSNLAAVQVDLDSLLSTLATQRAGGPDSIAPPLSAGPTGTDLKRAQDLLSALPDRAAAGPGDARPSIGGSVVLDKGARIATNPRAFVRTLIDRAPYLMFVLVPTFALLLKGLYRHQRRLYLEHLIFALHVHALAFIVFAASAALGSLNLGTSVHLDGWLAASPFGYLFVALRHVYAQPVGATLRKMIALIGAYGIILVGAVVLLIVTTVVLM